jgi:hypothetical protein
MHQNHSRLSGLGIVRHAFGRSILRGCAWKTGLVKLLVHSSMFPHLPRKTLDSCHLNSSKAYGRACMRCARLGTVKRSMRDGQPTIYVAALSASTAGRQFACGWAFFSGSRTRSSAKIRRIPSQCSFILPCILSGDELLTPLPHLSCTVCLLIHFTCLGYHAAHTSIPTR